MRNNNNYPLSPYCRKVQHALAVANRKMMQRASIFGYSLVLGTPDGKGTEKDARELMDELRQSEWWAEHFDD